MLRRRPAVPALLAALTLMAAPLAGCGSDSDAASTDASRSATTSTGATTATTGTTSTAATAPTDTTLTLPSTTGTATAPAVTTGDEADAVRVVVVSYVAAYVDSDGPKACSLLTTESQQAFVDAVKDYVDATTCAAAFTEAANQVEEDRRIAFGRAEVSAVRVTGATATATLTVQGISNDFTLVRRDGTWRIANMPGT